MGSSIEPKLRGANLARLKGMQRVFVEELLADESFNATSAARKAGYKNPSVAGARNLKNAVVRAAIGKALQERIERCKLTSDEVLKHLAAALFLDPIDLMEVGNDGSQVVKNLEDIPPHVRRCITKIKQRTRYVDGEPDVTTEVEVMSKDSALTNALKHLGLVSPEGNTNNLVIAPNFLGELLEKVEAERKVIDGDYIEAKAKERK